MPAPKLIAAYFDAIANVGEFELVSEVLSGIHRYVRANGTLSLGPHPMKSVLVRPEDLQTWTGDGIIGFFYYRPAAVALMERGIGVLNLTEHLAPLPLPVVVSDSVQIGRIAAAHLLERGYRRFAYIGFQDLPFSKQRREGFLAELKKAQINESLVWTDELRGRDVSVEWFAHRFGRPEFPVGIMAADDDVAVRTLIAAQANGLRVPQDLAIIGVNDLDMICNTAAIPLSSITPQYGRIGFEAAQLLDRLLQGKAVHDTVIRVAPMGVVARMSTRFFAFDDPLVEQALTYMHANISEPFNVEDVVRQSGKSRRTLENRFTRAVGRSLHEEINRLRIERAKQLLTDTDWTIERVAEACGFAASKRLYEAFMREEGTTPNSFRGSENTEENVDG
jgi:LacI family transcriptional regulator